MATCTRISLRKLRIYQISDEISGNFICGMMVFTPWAFGTTQPWAIWTMNIAAYSLGILWGVKSAIRYSTGYRPARWDRKDVVVQTPEARLSRTLTRGLMTMTGLLLVYCLINVLNARSTYHPEIVSFEYFPFISWLPASHDRAASLKSFFSYLALALSFWAVHDWLAVKSPTEERAERQLSKETRAAFAPVPYARLRKLLWVLTISGGLLGIEGIVQRLSNTPDLLFLMPTYNNQAAEDQFGPYAYRANAAQYLNLAWPVCLGFWWMRQRARARSFSGKERRPGKNDIILGAVAIMAACPMISSSRVGALVDLIQITLASFILLSAGNRAHAGQGRKGILIFLVISLSLGIFLGWSKLSPRIDSTTFQKDLEARNTMYDMARPMARDYPLYGTGPGSFESVFQLYRIDPDEFWPAQLHNDWLETRITFGWVGCGLIGFSLLCALVRWFIPTGIPLRRYFAMLIWVAIGGCLMYARYDFPFQIYSILFLFVMLCSILFSISGKPGKLPLSNQKPFI